MRTKTSVYRAGISLAVCAALILSLICGLPVGSRVSAESAVTESEEHLTVDPTGKNDGYSAVLYDNTNGLPTSEANAITETKEGFIWIGSYSGLIRYDGNTFERIDSTSGIASVVSLYTDSKNRLWVGTNDNGAAVMENGEFRMYNKHDGLKSLSVRSITEDSEGRIYIATTHGMAMIGDDMELHAIDEPQINDEYVRLIKTGADGVIYGVTMNGAVFTMKDGKLTGYYDPKKLGVKDIRTILPDPDDPQYVYLASKQSALYRCNLQKSSAAIEMNDLSPLGYVNAICRVEDMTWVCTDNGIGFVRNGRNFTLDSISMNTSVENMMVDYQGNLWFVSSQQGVMKIVPNQFSDIYAKYGLDDEVVYSTCIRGYRLFIGTKNSGLRVIDRRYGKAVEKLPIMEAKTASGVELGYKDLLEILGSSRIRSIIRDSQDRLWISVFGENSLVRYDGNNALVFTTEDGLPSDRVRAVAERSDGSFMVACTGGLALIKDDKVAEVYGESAGISNPELLTALEADSGDMLIGTDGDGIYVLGSDNNTLHLGTDSGLGSDVVMRIKRDRTRELYWIVTSNSIACMTPDYKITTIWKFPYSNNFDMYQNSADEMWVLSSNGIYVVPTEELIRNGDISPIYYGRDNGLSCISTSNSYSELTDSGDLYISGTTGIAKVNIETPFESVSTIKMAVPYIEADGKAIYPDSLGRMIVPSDVSKVTIYSYVYNYSLMNPQVTYCLEGFDRNETTVKRSDLVPIDYTNLKGGNYTFTMRISDLQGHGSKELSIEIVKQKNFYEMLWFRILEVVICAALVIGISMLIFRYRTKKYIRKEQENKQLIREIVEAFAKVIDMKDKYTNGHSSRVAEYTSMLTKELGYSEETVEQYYNIALLHDIGKVGVPPEVLNKPGKLTDTEFAIIKSHSALGYNTLKDISIMPELAIGAGAHHERPDGKGYPKGLKGEEIPRVAQIIAVADTFDAMYSDRPYRKRMNFEKAVSIVSEVRGTQLADDVVDAFLRLVEKGEFRAPDDNGGGTTEDIDNIHKRLAKQEAKKEIQDDKNKMEEGKKKK